MSEEWAWLCGWEEADQSSAFFPSEARRLRKLWEGFEGEVRKQWEARPPDVLPPGHPAHPGPDVWIPIRGAAA